jgi:hypothetical protein
LKNLLAKQEKWSDKFTKADATTVENLQAKKQSDTESDAAAALIPTLGRRGLERANPEMTAEPGELLSAEVSAHEHVTASLELLAQRAQARQEAACGLRQKAPRGS